jgi:hypothetical protein
LGRIDHVAITPFYVGWGVFSKADWLLVYALDSQAFYLFRFKMLREDMQRYTLENRTKSEHFKWVASDDERTTLNLLIPLRKTRYYRFPALNGGWVMKQGGSS